LGAAVRSAHQHRGHWQERPATEKARESEFFLEREAAEAMIREVREDDPVLAEVLRVEAIELKGPRDRAQSEIARTNPHAA
jgi:hypothetical protein